MVKESCRLLNEKHLQENIIQKDKLNIVKEEACTRKSYINKMTLAKTRILF